MSLRRLILIAIVAVVGFMALGEGGRAQPREEGRTLTADEVGHRLARRGYRDVGPPQRRGQIYLVEATDRDGARRVLVVTVTEALVVGDGPVPQPNGRRAGRAMTAAEHQ